MFARNASCSQIHSKEVVNSLWFADTNNSVMEMFDTRFSCSSRKPWLSNVKLPIISSWVLLVVLYRLSIAKCQATPFSPSLLAASIHHFYFFLVSFYFSIGSVVDLFSFSEQERLKELPGTTVTGPDGSSAYGTEGPLTTLPGSESDYPQYQHPDARNVEFLQSFRDHGGLAEAWDDVNRPPIPPLVQGRESQAPFAEFERIYDSSGSSHVQPTWDGKVEDDSFLLFLCDANFELFLCLLLLADFMLAGRLVWIINE